MNAICDYIKNKGVLYASLILLCGAILFIFLSALCKHGWVDEHVTILSSLVPWCDFCQNLAVTDVYPPLHYAIEGVIGRLCRARAGGVEMAYALSACQLFSVACFIVLLILGAAILKKRRGWSAAIAYMAVLCSLPLCERYCIEARAYMMCTLILFASFICACLAFRHNNRRWWIVYSILLVLLAYTNYYALLNGVVLTGMLFVYAFLFARRHCSSIVYASLCALICFVPWMPYLLQQIGWVHESWWNQNPLCAAFGYIVDVCGVRLSGGSPWIFFIVASCVQVYALSRALAKRESLSAFIIGCGMLAVPCSALLQIIISIAIEQSIVVNRYCLFPVGVFAFSLAWGLPYLSRLPMKGFAFLCACISVFACRQFYLEEYNKFRMNERLVAWFLLNSSEKHETKLYVSEQKEIATVELLFDANQIEDINFCLCHDEKLDPKLCIARYSQYRNFLSERGDMNLSDLREGDYVFVLANHMEAFVRDMEWYRIPHKIVSVQGLWYKVAVSPRGEEHHQP